MKHVSSSSSLKSFGLLGLFVLLLLGCTLQAANEAQGPINLVFTGSGTVLANQTSFQNRYNFKTKRYESGIATNTGRKPFSGSGNVEINGAFARIKLPSALVPLLSSDNDGWFSVNDFFMNDREITGIVRINALNKPKLHIDRNTGIITLAGGLCDFTGQCELVRTDTEHRKF